MSLADETNGISCKKFFDRPEEAGGLEELKAGMAVKVRGNVRFDKYSGGLVLELQQVEKEKSSRSIMKTIIRRPASSSISIRR